MACRGYVYPVIKLIRKVLCLFIFVFAQYLSNKFDNWINITST